MFRNMVCHDSDFLCALCGLISNIHFLGHQVLPGVHSCNESAGKTHPTGKSVAEPHTVAEKLHPADEKLPNLATKFSQFRSLSSAVHGRPKEMNTGWECFKTDSVNLGFGKMVPLPSLTCYQQRDSYQPARSVDTSKTIPSSQISAATGSILSARRMHLNPAPEIYSSKPSLLHEDFSCPCPMLYSGNIDLELQKS
ncbi:C-type lectin domain family 9 member A isoform X1 [Sigmodon hispidus]